MHNYLTLLILSSFHFSPVFPKKFHLGQAGRTDGHILRACLPGSAQSPPNHRPGRWLYVRSEQIKIAAIGCIPISAFVFICSNQSLRHIMVHHLLKVTVHGHRSVIDHCQHILLDVSNLGSVVLHAFQDIFDMLHVEF